MNQPQGEESGNDFDHQLLAHSHLHHHHAQIIQCIYTHVFTVKVVTITHHHGLRPLQREPPIHLAPSALRYANSTLYHPEGGGKEHQ